MSYAPFVPLRVFSAFTMLEGAIEPKKIPAQAKKLGFPAIAMCDRNGLYGVMAFQDACKSEGVQPIIGVLLAVARIAGETAPLLFTALNSQFWNADLSKPMASLPVTIFKFAMSPYENWQSLAWAGVFLITMAVLGLNIVARIVTRQK